MRHRALGTVHSVEHGRALAAFQRGERGAGSGVAACLPSPGGAPLGGSNWQGIEVDDPGQRAPAVGIAGTAYDTAWLAGVGRDGPRGAPSFPSALRWLTDHQLADGSWGGVVQYEQDRALSTLAALTALARHDHGGTYRPLITGGTRYLWQHAHLPTGETNDLVAFELLLPALARRARRSGISVPPSLEKEATKREEKLCLIPPEALYSPRVTVVHSLEFLGDDAETAGLRAAQGVNGAIGNSPAATAFYLERCSDPRALAYLESCLARCGGAAVPVLDPCETFETLWAAYHRFLAGVPSGLLLRLNESGALLAALGQGGVSLSPSFPIPDADDTAVALLLLHDMGVAVDSSVLQPFATFNGYFASFPHERHSSVGVNLHVLHTLLYVSGYPEPARTVQRLLDYISAQQIDGLYWLDKWHISPYYATAHALCVLSQLPSGVRERMEPQIQQSLEWVRQTQNGNGSWGFYNTPTLEETAYGILALGARDETSVTDSDRRRCAAALRYLQAARETDDLDSEESVPPLWIDKCLYTPRMVVRGVIESAMVVGRRVADSSLVASVSRGSDMPFTRR